MNTKSCLLAGAVVFQSLFAAVAVGKDSVPVRVQLSDINRAAPNEPPGKLVLEDACPFEGCQLGIWRATKDISLYRSPTERSTTVTVRSGQCVEAKRGEVHTVSPGRFTFGVSPSGMCEGSGPGTVHSVYAYIGEGYFLTWFQGRWQAPSIGFQPDEERDRWEKNVCGVFDPTPTNIWWVWVELPDGESGWTNEGMTFSGKSFLDIEDPEYGRDCRIVPRGK